MFCIDSNVETPPCTSHVLMVIIKCKNRILLSRLIFTARKRSLGQGNVFLHLCVILFTGGWGGRSASRGWADHPFPPIGYYGIRSTSGRYASYWNAFLYEHVSGANSLSVNSPKRTIHISQLVPSPHAQTSTHVHLRQDSRGSHNVSNE